MKERFGFKGCSVVSLLLAVMLLLVSCGFGGNDDGGGSGGNKEYSDATFTYTGSSVRALNTSISGEIVIPQSYNGVTIDTIPAGAFKNCSGITSIIIPNTVTSIGKGAFSGCSSLRSITVPFVGAQKGNSGEAALFGYIFGTESYNGGKSTEQYYGTGSGIINTQYDYFYIPSTLRTVTVTNESSLGYGAFYNCSMLTEINLNDQISQVGQACFYNCAKIEKISLPNIIVISKYMLSYCISLKSFTIGEKVDTIAPYAFNACSSLSSINSDVEGCYVIPDEIISIGEGAFWGCRAMKDITLPFVGAQKGNTGEAALFGYVFGAGSYEGGTSIKQHYNSGYWDYETFYIPSALRSVTITGETILGYGAFYNCSMLTSFKINKISQSDIGTSAFYNCVEPTWQGGDAFG